MPYIISRSRIKKSARKTGLEKNSWHSRSAIQTINTPQRVKRCWPPSMPNNRRKRSRRPPLPHRIRPRRSLPLFTPGPRLRRCCPLPLTSQSHRVGRRYAVSASGARRAAEKAFRLRSRSQKSFNVHQSTPQEFLLPRASPENFLSRPPAYYS
jgi:hypothetical protein